MSLTQLPASTGYMQVNPPPTTRRIVVNEHNEQDYRAMGLRESVLYFGHVRRTDVAPPSATVVLEMASHFARWIATGTMPIKETE